MYINPFSYYQPSDLKQACQLLVSEPVETAILAGGSELLIQLKQGVITPQRLISLTAINDLSYLRYEQHKGLEIGTLTKLCDLEKSPLIRQHYPVLAEAASKVASAQIRNMATLGGNICQDTMCRYYNQSHMWKQSMPPCYKAGGTNCHLMNDMPGVCYATYRGDLATVLIALEAEAVIMNNQGERRMALADLFTGAGKDPLNINRNEILKAIWIPSMSSQCSYLKLSHRRAVDYPLVGVAANLVLDSSGQVEKARVVLGAVASGPVLLKIDEIVANGGLTENNLVRVGEMAAKAASPRNNMAHGSPVYRRRMVQVLVRKALKQAVEDTRRY